MQPILSCTDRPMKLEAKFVVSSFAILLGFTNLRGHSTSLGSQYAASIDLPVKIDGVIGTFSFKFGTFNREWFD